MAWTSLTFPGSSLLTSALMNDVASNFAAVVFQESGSPAPAGTWSFAAASVIDAPGSHHFGQIRVDSGISGFTSPESFASLYVSSGINAPQTSSFGTLNVVSGYQHAGNYGQIKIQEQFASKYTTQSNCTTTFSTFLVCSITPIFSDSVLVVEADVMGMIILGATQTTEYGRVNLCRVPNGTPVVLTTSDASAPPVMDLFTGVSLGSAPGGASLYAGEARFTAVDCALNGATQYGIRFAALQVVGSEARAVSARIRVSEWR